jgi:hypothetical protein
MRKLGLEIEIKKIRYDSGETHYLLTVLDASDGLTNRIFFPHKGGSLIRVVEGDMYSLTKGISLVKGYPEIIENRNWDGEIARPCSQGEFPLNIDPDDVLILVIREREKLRNSLAQKGESRKIYI